MATFLILGIFLAIAGRSQTEPVRPGDAEGAEDVAFDAVEEVTFREEITVGLSTIVVRVVDRQGQPVPGLARSDFRVRIGKRETEIVAVDWVSRDATGWEDGDFDGIATLDDILAADTVAAGTATEGPSRFVVFFVQTDFEGLRRRGHRNVQDHVRRLPWSLPPTDWTAVVFYDSHLKLWQDFTRDRGLVDEALGRSILFGGERVVRPGRPPSLARHFDFEAAREATSPEKGLELTARALAAFPGQKIMIYVGWGLGSFEGRAGVRMTHEYEPAVEALAAADTTVFVLDASYADFHSLEVGLQQIADDTGGMYVRGFRFPESAVDRLARSISGYYLLTLDHDGLPAKGGKLRVELRGKKGRILARPYFQPPEPSRSEQRRDDQTQEAPSR